MRLITFRTNPVHYSISIDQTGVLLYRPRVPTQDDQLYSLVPTESRILINYPNFLEA